MEHAPSLLLPILRSQQQAEVLTWILEDPERETSLAELSRRLGVAPASIHREVQRAEQAGLLVSRRVGRARLVRANKESRLLSPLRELLVRAFGAPSRLGAALCDIAGIESAFIFGSWAARFLGVGGSRAVGDVDVLVLGSPDRDRVYEAVTSVEAQLGHPVQVTFRDGSWLEAGTGSFHDTIAGRPMIQIVGGDASARKAAAVSTASAAQSRA